LTLGIAAVLFRMKELVMETLDLSIELSTEIEQLRGEKAWQSGRNSKTLAKYSDLSVVLMVLKCGAGLHEHKTAGSISVQTIAGHIRMHAQDKTFDLPVGHLLSLEPELPHDVEALEDSAFLLTIAVHGNAKKS
jgi:quercetin dioxygenase-like cupin family protein